MVASALATSGIQPYYYHAPSGSPEIDFVFVGAGVPTMVECKATNNRMTSMRYLLEHPEKYGKHPAVKFADTNVGGGKGFTTYPHYALGFLPDPRRPLTVPEVVFPGFAPSHLIRGHN